MRISAKIAPKAYMECSDASLPGAAVASASISGSSWRARISAGVSPRVGSARSAMRPSAKATSPASAPWSGWPWSPRASPSSFARARTAADCTALPTLAMVIEPPWTGAFGKSVSPSSNRTRSTGRPSVSAATCVMAV
jgi:hypothetical protein